MKGMVKGLIIGFVIAVIGVVILLVALGMNDWKPLGKEPVFETRTFTAEDSHSVLDLNLDARTVKTEFYDGDKITVEYPEAGGFTTNFEERGNELKITSKTTWYSFGSCATNVSFTVPAITIKLPTGKYDLSVDMDAGSFSLADGEYGKITLNIDAGAFTAGTIKCASFECDMDAGSATVTALECTQKLACDIDAGKVEFFKLSSPDTRVTIDAGSAKLNFTGNQEEYDITVKESAGSCNVSDQTGTTSKDIYFDLDAGSITATFNN